MAYIRNFFFSGHFDEIFISIVDFCKFDSYVSCEKRFTFLIGEPRKKNFLIYS